MTVELKDGYKVEVRENSLNDWGVLKMLRNIDKGESALIVDVAERLLGEEQTEALAEHLKADGVTPIDLMVAALQEIMEASTTVKNS